MSANRFLALWLVAVSAQAQWRANDQGQPTRAVPPAIVTPGSGSTTGALNLFVNCSTGSDSNACTSSASPCLTIQGAVNLVPKRIRDPVTITVSANACAAGAYIENFTFEAGAKNSGTTGAWLQVVGTFANSTLATGTATGTLSSFTAGNGWLVKDVVTDSTQTWTAGNLRGRFFVVTGGAANGQIRMIEDNTGTTITLTRPFVTAARPDATTTYAIQDSGTAITGNLAQPIQLDPHNPNQQSTYANAAAFIISNNGAASETGLSNAGSLGPQIASANIQINKFSFNGCSRAAIVKNSQQIRFWLDQFPSITADPAVYLRGPANIVTVSDGSATLSANVALMSAARDATPTGGMFPSGVFGMHVTGGAIYSANSLDQSACYNGSAQIGWNHVRSGNAANGILCLNGSGSGEFVLNAEVYDANSGGVCLQVGAQQTVNSSASLGGVVFLSGVTFTNCTGSAIDLGGPARLVSSSSAGNITGTGSTNWGIRIRQGATAELIAPSTNWTLTGTSGAITIDGSNTITLPNLNTNHSYFNLQTGSAVYDATGGVQ